jgi:hypothetical protein
MICSQTGHKFWKYTLKSVRYAFGRRDGIEVEINKGENDPAEAGY